VRIAQSRGPCGKHHRVSRRHQGAVVPPTKVLETVLRVGESEEEAAESSQLLSLQADEAAKMVGLDLGVDVGVKRGQGVRDFLSAVLVQQGIAASERAAMTVVRQVSSPPLAL